MQQRGAATAATEPETRIVLELALADRMLHSRAETDMLSLEEWGIGNNAVVYAIYYESLSKYAAVDTYSPFSGTKPYVCACLS
jgi:hypothetical protein